MESGKNEKKNPWSMYAKYSGMAFQMAGIIFLGCYGGIKLDEWLEMENFPVFTVTLSLLSIFFAMYYVIKGFLRK